MFRPDDRNSQEDQGQKGGSLDGRRLEGLLAAVRMGTRLDGSLLGHAGQCKLWPSFNQCPLLR